jgi:hypothetical protein
MKQTDLELDEILNILEKQNLTNTPLYEVIEELMLAREVIKCCNKTLIRDSVLDANKLVEVMKVYNEFGK